MNWPFPYTIRRSRRAKRLRLVVKPAGVELVVPADFAESRAREFLALNKDWVLRQVAAMQDRLAAMAMPPPPRLTGAGTVPFQGREVPLVIREHSGRHSRIVFDDGFVISVPPGTPEQAELAARATLLGWARGWLRQEAERLATHHGQREGLLPRQIRIKQMRSRWGSCGPHNDINLNLVLAFAPPAQLEYVVVHELCHIRHRNHSPDFWNLVSQHLPDWRERRRWLREHGGPLLTRFG